MAGSELFTITFIGDVMLGRLIDQLLPVHVDEPEEAEIVASFRQKHSQLQDYTHASPWGNVVALFQKSDLVLANLETSATTHDVKWPNKVFNYRMHPDNVRCLKEAGVDCVSLANNHTLDFSLEGLLETVETLKTAGVAITGAGSTASDAALPAILTLKHASGSIHSNEGKLLVHVYSFSDHPSDWNRVGQFNFLEYTSEFKQKLKTMMVTGTDVPSLKVVSVHWGPNYQWQPDRRIQDMAHHFIDECNVDIVWGHSSHHVQGVEIYKRKLIIYGCGDFVDDYAVNREYRNDLSAAWNVQLESRVNQMLLPDLRISKLEVWPNRIKHFQAGLLDAKEADHEWIERKFRQLCKDFGTKVEADLGAEGQIIVDLTRQHD